MSRPPLYVSKETAMRLLGWPESMWNAANVAGFFPPPIELMDDCIRWRWADIRKAMGWGSSPPRPAQPGDIYFVSSGQFIKIGYTTDIVARIRTLQNGSPSRLVLLGIMPGTMREEAALHAKFTNAKVHGEWFRATSRLRGWINRHCPYEGEE